MMRRERLPLERFDVREISHRHLWLSCQMKEREPARICQLRHARTGCSNPVGLRSASSFIRGRLAPDRRWTLPRASDRACWCRRNRNPWNGPRSPWRDRSSARDCRLCDRQPAAGTVPLGRIARNQSAIDSTDRDAGYPVRMNASLHGAPPE